MKKTDIDKVLGRKPYIIIYGTNRLKEVPYKEQIVIRDFTSKNMRYG